MERKRMSRPVAVTRTVNKVSAALCDTIKLSMEDSLGSGFYDIRGLQISEERDA